MPYAMLSNDFGYDIINNWIEYANKSLPKMKDKLNNLPIPQEYNKTVYITHIPPSYLNLGQLLHQDLDIGSNDRYKFFKER